MKCSSTDLNKYWVQLNNDKFAGRRIEWHPPYVKDPLSQERIRNGLHVPVKSCWNGLVVIKAAPFINEGLKFR